MEVLQEKVIAIITRAREVNNKAKIKSWLDTADGPTITKTANIPVTYQKIRQYMNHTINNRRVRSGKNNGWRIRITSLVQADEFVHYWNLSKRVHMSGIYNAKESTNPMHKIPLNRISLEFIG